MARLLGIDATKTAVRVAIIRTAYRRVTLEALEEVDIATAGSEAEAIRLAISAVRPDAAAIALSGERVFFRKLDLPLAAQREIGSVLSFELESTVPFEMEDAVFDHRTLRRANATGPETIPVFAVIARTDDVRDRIRLVREVLGIEPARVGAGPVVLASLLSLMPDLEPPPGAGPVALLDIGSTVSELLIVVGGEAVFARTVSRGTAGLPESAPALARELRQTLAAWRTGGGDPLHAMYLLGPGAAAPGADLFLSTELGVTLLPLPRSRLEGIPPEQSERLPRFAKALSLAVDLDGRSKSFNLRRGALAAERRYPFLREKIPLLAGLGAVIAVSAGFSVIAEMRSLDAEHDVLTARLSAASRDVLGEETTDPAAARAVLDQTTAKADEDPLPRVDAFDVMVGLSKAVPHDMVHDVVEFDVSRGHVAIQGLVSTVAETEQIAKNLKDANRCFKDIKVVRTSDASEGKKKYALEFELKCEETRRKKDKDTPDAAPSGTAKADKPEAPK